MRFGSLKPLRSTPGLTLLGSLLILTVAAASDALADGWSPTGSVELIVGHCYIVWTRDDNYAKFRVVALTSDAVTFDWAYQTARGNRELAVRPSHLQPNVRRTVSWAH